MSNTTTPPAADSVNQLLRSIARNSFSLGLFSILTVGLIAFTYVSTRDRISEQVRTFEARALMEILPEKTHDNVLLDTQVPLKPSPLLATQEERHGYVAYQGNTPVAVILPAVAPDGYNGRIELLVGITMEGTLAGVRVVTHKETPGLGDKIDTKVSDWILGFKGKSFLNPTPKGWAVKKDGGQFDQFTGATITPRAVVAAVYRTLEYFKANQKYLMSTQWLQASPPKEHPDD